jgi:hypothetical protein
MKTTGKSLETSATPLGIINLEIAPGKVIVQAVLHAWEKKNIDAPDNISVAKINIYLDFLFILFYAPFLYFSSKTLSAGFYKKTFIARAVKPISVGIIAAAILDVLENIGMLQSLHGHISDKIALFTTICSLAKWGLVFLSIAFILFTLVSKLFQPKKK